MKTTSTIVFTGDISFDRYMDGKWNDPDLIAQPVLDFLHSSDHVVANVEGALINVAPGYDPTGRGIFCHSMNTEAVRVLRNIRADIWNLANNHTMDMGAEGMRSTLQIARHAKAQTIGSGMNLNDAAAPVYLDEAGGIGLMSVGCQPVCVPIRGGTDGARLSWEGLPCPNLPTGGYNFHSIREWIPVKSLDTMADVLVTLIHSFAEDAG